MARRFVVGVYDFALQAYGTPVFVPSVGAALRSFQDEVNRPGENNALNQHPSDFELCVLAVFDDESGAFEPYDGQRVVARGKDCVRVKE